MNPYTVSLQPIGRLAVTIAQLNTFTTLYDSGDPAGAGQSGVLPDKVAYIHVRCTSQRTGLDNNDGVLVEVRHLFNNTVISVEEFGLPCPVSAADANGVDLRAVLCGYPIITRGNRLVIAAGGTDAEMVVDWTLNWGESEPGRQTQVGGFDAYVALDAAEDIARIGLLRPMKTCIIQATLTATAGVIPAVTGTLNRVVRSTAGTAIESGTRFTVTPAGALVDVEAVVANVNIAADDEFVGFDFLILRRAAAIAGASGTIHWRVTCLLT